MSWSALKGNADERKAELDKATSDTVVDTLATQLNRSIKQYASTGGISSDSTKNQAQIDANKYLGQLVNLDKQYKKLNNDLTIAVKNLSTNSDINAKLTQIGTLRNDIAKLEKTLQDVTKDVDVSKNRKGSVENTDLNVSSYQGFASKVGFIKPLHTISIPILIGFGIFLLIMSGLMLKEVFQVPGQPVNQVYESENLFSLFTDSRLYSVIASMTLVVVVLGILSYRGYFGKTMN